MIAPEPIISTIVIVAIVAAVPAISITVVALAWLVAASLIMRLVPAMAATFSAVVIVTLSVEVTATFSVSAVAASILGGVVPLSVRVGHLRPVSVSDIARPSRVLSDFVSNLASCLTAAELAMRLEAVVPVNSDHHTVQHLPV